MACLISCHLTLSVQCPLFVQDLQNELISDWTKLYQAFARSAVSVVTAEANVWCEELCVQLLPLFTLEVLTVSVCPSNYRQELVCLTKSLKLDTHPIFL